MLKNVLLKTGFFNQINIIINWKSISNIISEHYTVGISATGTPSTDGLLLFKMLLIGIWYDLSDRDVEDMVSENLSAMKFCGYKMHASTDENGLVIALTTTPANLHDSKEFEKLIEKTALPKGSSTYADKAYRSKENSKVLKRQKFKK